MTMTYVLVRYDVTDIVYKKLIDVLAGEREEVKSGN